MEAAATTLFGSSLYLHPPSSPVAQSAFFTAGTRPSFSQYYSLACSRSWNKRMVLGSRRGRVVRASSSSPDSADPSALIAPLRMESPIGQFLSQILMSHPHLMLAAVEQQLEQLQTEWDAEQKKEVRSASGTELALHRRIAEVKANERNRALEEILYALVVQKFMDANVSLVPAITPSSMDPLGRVDTWPSQEDKLVQLHSLEANEMIQNHLSLILGDRADDLSTVAQTSKRMIGQVYAASAMYGYFLKRVDQRFQLEKTMKILPNALDAEGSSIELAVREDIGPAGDYQAAPSRPEVSSWSGIISPEEYTNLVKPSRLRTYVMAFDGETLQRFATIRSKEAVSIIEKHTEALFGRPGTAITPRGTAGSSKNERIKISFGGLKRLVLEAVTFGSFLWDVESFVDSRYHFVTN
ncbi:UV-B-induced protein At3g17800, chloroplastic-like isoform X2 [Hibiscus syriacus]|uniref:UV-B-induced protein At3g17800, chloroplastic-like isoform X2 n=1 Tax=Hibiscus syriacus TaxID=106335 RepID=UPI001921BFAD|nr:UV-B-induced protein At3g17800, chloroplastic-like isoform X2 [Hibiscus syriacus]